MREMIKAESEARHITMRAVLTEIIAVIDGSYVRYHAPTFDADSTECYLSASVSKKLWLRFKKVSKKRGVYLKILLRNMLRKRYQ